MRILGRFCLLVALAQAAGCRSTPAVPASFPPARPPPVARAPSPSNGAWNRCSEELHALETGALLVHSFGCARCTRFVSTVLVLHHDARFWVVDRVTLTVLSHGRAPVAARDEARAVLESGAWRDVDPGAPIGERAGPWHVFVGGGKTVTLRTWASDATTPAPPTPAPLLALGAALRPVFEAATDAQLRAPELPDCAVVGDARGVNPPSRRTP